MLAGRKNLNSQTRPNGQDLKYLTPPCVPNLPFKSVYQPLIERKGSRPICFYIPPFFSCTQVTKIEKTKYKPHPFSQGAPCETITTQTTIFTKLRKWFRIQDHFLLLVLLYLSVEEVDVFNTMWWVCGDGSLQVGGRKGGAGADGGESIFQRSIIRISLGTCPEDWIFHIWRAQKRSNTIEMQASHANPTRIMGSAFFSLIALTIALFKEVVKGSAVSFWGGGR